MVPSLRACLEWYASSEAPSDAAEVCASRDVFQARLDSALRELLRLGWPESEAALLVAVVGEIGNNTYDHNLGRWPDAAGCWFGREPGHDPPVFWVADRGVGFLATLSRVDPSLTTPRQAVDAAFERVLSGRAPERRGNGLKFVRSVVNGHDGRGLVCQSEGASVELGGLLGPLVEAKTRLAATATPGVAAVLAWRPQL